MSRSAFLGAVALSVIASACLNTPLESGDQTTTTAPVVTIATTTSISPTTTLPAPSTSILLRPLLTEQSTVTLGGLRPVLVGMTVEEAEEAAQTRFSVQGEEDARCYFIVPDSGPDGVSFMVYDGKIARVDVTHGEVTTKSGAGIGSTEDEVLELYGERIEVTDHQYVEGHYLTFVPVDQTGYRLVFETDGERVTSYRSGQLPMAEWVEGCA